MADKFIDTIVAYAKFRKYVMGYEYSGAQLWSDIKTKNEIRGAVGWAGDRITDLQYPDLLKFFLLERNNIKSKY